MFSVPRDHDRGELCRHKHRPNRGQQLLVPDLSAGNLPDGAVKFLGIRKVDCRNIADGAASDLLGQNLHTQPDARKDNQLRPGIETIHIFRGIGLGISALLRLA